jgi:hypothetical protein
MVDVTFDVAGVEINAESKRKLRFCRTSSSGSGQPPNAWTHIIHDLSFCYDIKAPIKAFAIAR